MENENIYQLFQTMRGVSFSEEINTHFRIVHMLLKQLEADGLWKTLGPYFSTVHGTSAITW